MRQDNFAGATDPVALEILGALLSASRPKRVLQLGTYAGFSAVFLADILKHNLRPGALVTVEPDGPTHELARTWARRARLDNVTFVDGYSTEPPVVDRLRELGPFELIYIDSSHIYKETLAELNLIFDQQLLADGGLVALHDAAIGSAEFDRTGEGGVPRALEEWIALHPSLYRFITLEPPVFATLCGLGLLSRA